MSEKINLKVMYVTYNLQPVRNYRLVVVDFTKQVGTDAEEEGMSEVNFSY